MKIYNRSKTRFLMHWNPDDLQQDPKKDKNENPPLKVYELKAERSLNVPPGLAKHLLEKWPKQFTADEEQVAAEVAAQQAIEERDQKITQLEGLVGQVEKLIRAAGDTKNRKAAQAAAEQLDQLLASHRIQTAAPAAAPALEAEVPAEAAKGVPEGDFDSKT